MSKETGKVIVDKKKCIGWFLWTERRRGIFSRFYECVRNSPAGAMSKETGKVIVDKKKCIGCFCCDEVCDFEAIEMKRSMLGRTLLGMAKALGVEKVE